MNSHYVTQRATKLHFLSGKIDLSKYVYYCLLTDRCHPLRVVGERVCQRTKRRGVSSRRVQLRLLPSQGTLLPVGGPFHLAFVFLITSQWQFNAFVLSFILCLAVYGMSSESKLLFFESQSLYLCSSGDDACNHLES